MLTNELSRGSDPPQTAASMSIPEPPDQHPYYTPWDLRNPISMSFLTTISVFHRFQGLSTYLWVWLPIHITPIRTTLEPTVTLWMPPFLPFLPLDSVLLKHVKHVAPEKPRQRAVSMDLDVSASVGSSPIATHEVLPIARTRLIDHSTSSFARSPTVNSASLEGPCVPGMRNPRELPEPQYTDPRPISPNVSLVYHQRPTAHATLDQNDNQLYYPQPTYAHPRLSFPRDILAPAPSYYLARESSPDQSASHTAPPPFFDHGFPAYSPPPGLVHTPGHNPLVYSPQTSSTNAHIQPPALMAVPRTLPYHIHSGYLREAYWNSPSPDSLSTSSLAGSPRVVPLESSQPAVPLPQSTRDEASEMDYSQGPCSGLLTAY
ncbi:hypothetical protein ONZ45_g1666 [Pleurotus djamor]|nr:hypothetical protein ONZ45_g1666 [Pleurotus djamor]